MPELPDLEVYKDNIFNRLTSKRLKGLTVFSRNIILPENELAGTELQSITRHGKELLFDFAEGRIISAHLMLNGRIAITNEAESIRSRVLSLHFENEQVVFHDTGDIGTVIRYKPKTGGAPDALADSFTYDYFLKAARKKQATNIKAFLIDQKIIKGIGNAYADEILWAARISPKSVIGKIPEEALSELYKAIGTTLREAVASIKEISPDIISGEERSFLKVHVKFKKTTETGFPIISERVVSKITYFTEEQTEYK